MILDHSKNKFQMINSQLKQTCFNLICPRDKAFSLESFFKQKNSIHFHSNLFYFFFISQSLDFYNTKSDLNRALSENLNNSDQFFQLDFKQIMLF